MGGLLSSLILYWRNVSIEHWSGSLRNTLMAIRSVAVFLIIVLLLGPLLRSNTQESEKPVILLGLDNSSSILNTKDSSVVESTLQRQVDEFIEAVSDKYSVNSFLFGSEITEGSILDFESTKTDLSKVLLEFDERFVGRNVGATVILSDGIVNRGADPEYHKKRVSGPLYSVALGDTSLQRDQLIASVEHNQYAYLGNRFPIEVNVQAYQMSGTEAQLTVSATGNEEQILTIPIEGNDFNRKFKFELAANELGVVRISSTLKPVENELSPENNRKDVFVEVLDGRQKVLLLAGSPHPDVAAIKKAIQGNQNYEVDAIVAGQKDFEINDYDLVIMHQLPRRDRSAQREQQLVMGSDVPVWVIVGMQTDLRGLVSMNLVLNVNSNGNSANEVLPIIDRDFPLFTLDDGLPRLLSNVPPLVTHFADFELSSSNRSLLEQRIGSVETNDPLWVFSEQSGRKFSLLLGTGLWKWRMKDYQLNGSHILFDQLVSKTVQFMAAKTDKSLFRVSVPSSIAEDDALTVQAELYNESYELVNEPDVNFVVRKDDGAEFSFTMGRTENAYRLNAGSFDEGDYTYIARTSFNGKAFEKSGKFRVAALRLESAQTQADHGLMYRIAEKNGGKMFLPEQLDALADEILNREDIRNVIYERTWFMEVIDLKWLFAILVALLGAEWFLRKRNGAY